MLNRRCRKNSTANLAGTVVVVVADIAATLLQFDEAPVVQNLDVSAVQRHIQSAKPIVNSAASTVDTVWPVLEKGYHVIEDAYGKLQPYKPELALPIILGLFLIFFGVRTHGLHTPYSFRLSLKCKGGAENEGRSYWA
jgi:hypothetical protein